MQSHTSNCAFYLYVKLEIVWSNSFQVRVHKAKNNLKLPSTYFSLSFIAVTTNHIKSYYVPLLYQVLYWLVKCFSGLELWKQERRNWLIVAISHLAIQLSIPYKLSWCSTSLSSLKLIDQMVFWVRARKPKHWLKVAK